MNDSINRQEALNIIKEIYDESGPGYHQAYLLRAYDRIARMWPRNPLRRGHWIMNEGQSLKEVINGNFMYSCSCCGAGEIHSKKMDVPYCWHCGARMDGEQDETD